MAGGLGASPQEFNVIRYQKDRLFRTIKLGVSAGIMENPSRTAKIFVFGLIGLAKDKPLPKKVPQGGKKKRKALAFR
ncbi:hypothetical protein COF09_23040 [Bacillus toyonensis]|nr:hypothetical protein COF09_23040 [Bacillus toyonensis]